MTGQTNKQLSGLVSEAVSVIEDSQARFAELNSEQLNWKPGADRWSVAQCFDHLLTANASYFPLFEKVLKGEKTGTFWGSIPWLPGIWGRMLIKAVSPESARKLKAPEIFHPASSSIDGAVIVRFVGQQNQIIKYMRAMSDLDAERIIISSPVTNVITYSLLDAYQIIVNHEKRHFIQAKKVAEMDGFPR